ncbi:DrmB family protein [Roseovarius sp. CH_XMU1461]|uniref:DrmB family protein n=1 Tax=Roseovarius sp. CH_XMU1461 TaxID=3107777 RepID=UPI00300BB660
MKEVGTVRRSQIIGPFGPGSIVDFRLPSGALLSGVMQGLEAWDGYSGPNKGLNDPNLIREPRLEAKLGIKGFRPPLIGQYTFQNEKRDRVLPVHRFPDWQSCPDCHVIQKSGMWAPSRGGDSLHCGHCVDRPAVVPVRFVAICEHGHLNDFPWDNWINHKPDCRQPLLKLVTIGAGINGLRLKCTGCSETRSIAEAFSPNGIPGHACRGGRPWLGDYETGCGAPARVTQRGASNTYFPVVESAITLPDWRAHFYDRLGANLSTMESIHHERNVLLAIVQNLVLPSWDGNESADEICDLYFKAKNEDADDATADLKMAEFQMLTKDTRGIEFGKKDLLNAAQKVPETLRGLVSFISSVERLREVRALTGFTRLKASVAGEPEPLPLSKSPKDWLPGIEVNGEGIFVALDQSAVQTWETSPAVETHIRGLQLQWMEAKLAIGEKPVSLPEELSARYILIHTLAHALISELSLESGYSSTSLRERLYASSDMAGLLIYTSTSDADGTMGGLSRQAAPSRFEHSFLRAVSSQELCSADPLCSGGLASDGASGNHSACHSCVFLPETSCESFNSFLDRTLLCASDFAFFQQLSEAKPRKGTLPLSTNDSIAPISAPAPATHTAAAKVVKVPAFQDELAIIEFGNMLRSDYPIKLDFSGIGFATPSGMLLLSRHIRSAVDRGIVAGYKGAEPNGYAANVGFFEKCGVDVPRRQALGGANYLPLQAVDLAKWRNDAEKSSLSYGGLADQRVGRMASLIARDTRGNLFDLMKYCLREIVRNALEHGNGDTMWITGQYWPMRDTVELSIFDNGIGILRSLQRNEKFSNIGDDLKALRLAVLPSTSGVHLQESLNTAGSETADDTWKNSGFGLYVTSQLARRNGHFVIGSGSKYLRIGSRRSEKGDFSLSGTYVSMNFSVADLQRAATEVGTIVQKGESIAQRYVSKDADVFASAASKEIFQ